MPEQFHDWLRLAVRVPPGIPAGEAEFELLAAGGDRYVWPVQMINNVGPYVPPSPDGIIWPAVLSSDGVFPVGTMGPFYAIADPLFQPSYPAPMNPPEVKYDLRLRKPGHFLCASAAPLQGEIGGWEQIDLVDENGAPVSVANPIFGTYDWKNNFVELTINRSAMGGSPELYRGGWVEGDYASIPEPSERGQLARPTSHRTLIALHAVRTGLPLTITHVSGTDAFEQACAVPTPYAGKHLQIQNLWRSDLFVNAQGEKLVASAVTDDSATWMLEPAEDGYYRIRNELSGAYLHYQGGEFQLGPIDQGWQSAEWEIDEFGEYVEIRNRLHPDEELNVEFGILESSALPDDYWSTRWVLSEVSSVSQPHEAQKAGIRSQCTRNRKKLSVMSYNVRSLNDGDTGSRAWEDRRARLAQQIVDHAPDLLGVQEATPEQMEDLADALPGYHWSGLGPQGGLEGGFSAVFYEKSRFTVLAEDTFWLSQDPERPASIGWQESLGLPRVVSWVKLFDQLNCMTMLHFNTQVGYGQEAQLNGALLLRERAAQISGEAPYVITGDFNFGSTTDPFGALVAPGRGALADTYPTHGAHQGPLGTFFAEMDPAHVQTPRIDFIFQVPGQFEVLSHAHLESVVDGLYPSDHIPVLVEFAPTP